MSDNTETRTEAPAASETGNQTQGESAPDPRDQRIAELERVANKNAEEAKKYRKTLAEQKEAAQTAMAENGEYKKLAELLTAERDQLQAQLGQIAPLAAEFEADKKARTEALKGRISGLSDDDQALVMGAGSLATQEALAARLLGLKPTVKAAEDVDGSTKAPDGPPKALADMTGAEIAARATSAHQQRPQTTFGGIVPLKQRQ
jgi:hypothetical protein